MRSQLSIRRSLPLSNTQRPRKRQGAQHNHKANISQQIELSQGWPLLKEIE
jgi:hypothetical protein